jgi:hypothetical protein
MPLNSYVVTIVDADGDEFPVRVEGDMPADREMAIELGAVKFADMVKFGEVKPAEPIQWEKVRLEV